MIALAMAALAHIAVLAVKFSYQQVASSTESIISVQLISEPEEDKEEIETAKPVHSTKPKPNQETPLPIPRDIIVAKPSTETAAEPKLKLQTNSDQFKRFLQQETDNYRVDNPQTVTEFSQTFEQSIIEDTSMVNDTPEARAQLRGIGVFAKQDKQGNRTCYGQIFNMLDVSAAPSYVGKDCTPEKKFELNMNKPNNGWMDR